jgi:septation ring formation regulator EzrA
MTTTNARQRQIGVDQEHPAVRVEEEHLTLRGQLDTIQAATKHAELHRDMLALEEMLLDHFAAEEQSGGLYDDLRKRRPALTSELDALRDEHQVIRDELDAIHLRLNGQIEAEPTVEVIPESMKRDVSRWLTRLRGHERKESLMIGEVYYTDEGGFG